MFKAAAQCTAVSVLLALWSFPAPAEQAPQATLAGRDAAADLWLEYLIQYLEMLERYLEVPGVPAKEVEQRISDVSAWFYQYGVPAGASDEDGLKIIAETHRHVQGGGGQLGGPVREQFLFDLGVMYQTLGGDPGELGLAP